MIRHGGTGPGKPVLNISQARAHRSPRRHPNHGILSTTPTYLEQQTVK